MEKGKEEEKSENMVMDTVLTKINTAARLSRQFVSRE